jgi:hypothetical protein
VRRDDLTALLVGGIVALALFWAYGLPGAL